MTPYVRGSLSGRISRRGICAATALVVAVAAFGAACGGNNKGEDDLPAPPTDASDAVHVSADAATTLELGNGARLIIPPGAMDDGTTVSANYGEPPNADFGALTPMAAPVELVSEPADAIHGLLTLEFPVELAEEAGSDAFGISTFQDGEWVPVASMVDTARQMVVAQIPHFSWWNPFSWDWAAVGARMNQRIGEILGKRAPSASCVRGQPTPPWVSSLAGISNDGAVAVRACAEGEGDVLAVELVNNRPYSMYVDYGSPVQWGWHEEGESQLDKVRNGFGDRLAGPDRLYLPPLGRASVGVLPTEGHHEFRIGYGRDAFAVDALSFALDEALEHLPGIDSCEAAIFTSGVPNELTPGAVRDGVADLFGCVQLMAANRGYFDSSTLAELDAYSRNLTVVGRVLKLGSYEWDLLDLYVDNQVVADSGLGAGFSVLGRSAIGDGATDSTAGGGNTSDVGGSSSPQSTPTTQPSPPTSPATTTPVTRPPTTQAAAPKPSVASLVVVNHGGGHVGVAFDVGWQSGRDPVTCHFLIDGREAFTAQCGTHASKQFYGIQPGDHSFSAFVTDRFGVTSATLGPIVQRVT